MMLLPDRGSARSCSDAMSAGSKIVIAGAGIGGLIAAMCLQRAGFEVEVFDR